MASLLSRLRRRPATDGAPPALLSVVVPAYDVEDYLAACLDSILDQSYPALEVVVVDDGSTDTTGAVADRYADRDPRVRVIHQANAGLGAARNEGTRQSTGAYLAFADSDDLVSPGAYERLVASLEGSGSDLAIGAVERFDDDRTFMTPLMRENHRSAAAAATIEDLPLVLADVFAWNKVYRRSFWDGAGLVFPEDVRYEDQPALTRALVQARAFDVLTEPVYRWRIRSDGSSISQQRADPRDLADRILTKRWSTEVVRERTSEATQRVWFARVLPIDMWEYFRAVPGSSDEFWAMLRAGVGEFWGPDTVPFEETALPWRQRVMGWLVSRGERSSLEEFLAFVDLHPDGLPRRVVGGREVVDHPVSDRPDLPDALRAP
ncbi:glycosyltransferase family 2 protein [Nocardioides ungokensis]